MKRFSALLVVVIILLCSRANAKSSNYVFTGKDMYESCTHALKGLDRSGEFDPHRFGVCAGYIAGIIDFHTVLTTVELVPENLFCLPGDITPAQVIREVTKFLADNPEKHQDLAAYSVILALRNAYPCRDEATGK